MNVPYVEKARTKQPRWSESSLCMGTLGTRHHLPVAPTHLLPSRVVSSSLCASLWVLVHVSAPVCGLQRSARRRKVGEWVKYGEHGFAVLGLGFGV